MPTKSFPAACSLLITICFAPTIALTLLLKKQQLSDIGYLVLSRNLAVNDPAQSILINSILFHQDLALGTLIIIAAILMAKLIGFRSLLKVSLAINLVLICFLYINLQSYGTVSRYISAGAFMDAMNWAMDHPQDLQRNVTTQSLAKFAATLTVSLCLHLFALYFYRHANKLKIKYLALLLWAGLLLPIVLIPVTTTTTTGQSSYATSTLIETCRQFVGSKEARDNHFQSLNNAEMASSPISKMIKPACINDTTAQGSAKGFSVVILSLETMPHAVVNLSEGSQQLPIFNSLLNNALFSPTHYSTYPYTSHALFSAYTSLYPTPRLEKTFAQLGDNTSKDFVLPGILRTAAANGYELSIHLPIRHSFSLDATVYQKLAPIKEWIAPQESNPATINDAPWKRLISRDEAALNSMLETIASHASSQQPFISAFLPQIGHAPWYDIEQTNLSVTERGKNIAKLHDRWAGEIIQKLKESGIYNNTLFVVFADHGIRTRNEDSAFRGGIIDPYSFHVPFFIHSPTVFPSREVVGHETTHVDIAPTLAHLLGLPTSDFAQGISMTCDALEGKRLIPFFADWYLGSDGFYDGQQYCMVNHIQNTSYCNSNFEFNNEHLVTDAELHSRNVRFIQRLKAYQERFVFLAAEAETNAQHTITRGEPLLNSD